MEPRGTPVLAVVSGTIRKLFLSKPGGNTIYLFDEKRSVLLLLRALGRVCGRVAGGNAGRARGRHRVCGIVGQCGCACAAPAFCHLRVGAGKSVVDGAGRQPISGPGRRGEADQVASDRLPWAVQTTFARRSPGSGPSWFAYRAEIHSVRAGKTWFSRAFRVTAADLRFGLFPTPGLLRAEQCRDHGHVRQCILERRGHRRAFQDGPRKRLALRRVLIAYRDLFRAHILPE